MSNPQFIRLRVNHAGVTLLIGLLAAMHGSVNGQESNFTRTPAGLILKQQVIPPDVTGVFRSVNEMLSKDLRPDENAVVLLVQLFGDDAFEKGLRASSLDLLGIDQLSNLAPRFVYFEQFANSIGNAEAETLAPQIALLPQQLVKGNEEPWTSTDLPGLFAFLNTNRGALDLLVEAINKPRYYAPVLSEEDPPDLLSASMNIERRLTFMARCLAARGLLRAAQHDIGRATDDLLACHRLAVLLATGSPFDVSGTKAQVIDEVAFRATVALIQSGKLRGQDAANYLSKLKRVPRLPMASVAADKGERAVLHRQIEVLKQDQSSVREFFELPDNDKYQPLQKVPLSEIRWDQVIARADEVQDQFVRALAVADRKTQYEQFTKLDNDYAKWERMTNATTGDIPSLLEQDRIKISRFMGETMAMSLRPWYWQRRPTDDSARVRRDILLVTAAIIAFRADHGDYPEELPELLPRYLDAIPPDAHTDAPLNYVRFTQDRMRLTSWGANHQHDQGQPGSDDVVIELR